MTAKLAQSGQNRHILTTMVNYVEAALAPARATTARSSFTVPPISPPCARPGGWSPSASTRSRRSSSPGLPTIEIDRFIYDFALAHDALPATLGYKGYMNSTCVSINHVVCHGIPATSRCATATSPTST